MRIGSSGLGVRVSRIANNAISSKIADPGPHPRGGAHTPAGTMLIDATTHLPAVGAMPMAMLRSPDSLGHGGKGRYLLVVNSGYGVQFSADTNQAQQSIAVIDLNASPGPAVIQNVYFPTPQSANVGLAFSPAARAGGI